MRSARSAHVSILSYAYRSKYFCKANKHLSFSASGCRYTSASFDQYFVKFSKRTFVVDICSDTLMKKSSDGLSHHSSIRTCFILHWWYFGRDNRNRALGSLFSMHCINRVHFFQSKIFTHTLCKWMQFVLPEPFEKFVFETRSLVAILRVI